MGLSSSSKDLEAQSKVIVIVMALPERGSFQIGCKRFCACAKFSNSRRLMMCIIHYLKHTSRCDLVKVGVALLQKMYSMNPGL